MRLDGTDVSPATSHGEPAAEFWSRPVAELFAELKTDPRGLTEDEARRRLAALPSGRLKPHPAWATLRLALAQFESPIILLLLCCAGLSLFLGGHADAWIILAIVAVSAALGFWQEYHANRAVAELLAIVKTTITVLRDGTQRELALDEIVPGDIVELSAGASIPDDGRVLESRDLFVDEAALTGETYPVAKEPGEVAAASPLAQRTNAVFQGTHVVSGSARALVVRTGPRTEFGKVAARLNVRVPLTEFEHGVRRFGYLLMEVTLLLTGTIFVLNVYFARPVLESFMFALALAVGLTPQLLPAIISVNLAHGARRMAKAKVIVRRLAAIENFGSMEILCCDKTGTLTEGVVRVHAALDAQGSASEKVRRFAYLNAAFESGFKNPLDEAIRAEAGFDLSACRKLDEAPYDFVRKRLSILAEVDGRRLLVTKGAVANVLDVSTSIEAADGSRRDLATAGPALARQFEELSRQGFRTLGVAYREVPAELGDARAAEVDLTFLGLLVLFDPPKPTSSQTIERLRRLGIKLKMITGDNRLVAAQVAQAVGLDAMQVLTGSDLSAMSPAALIQRAASVEVFAEIEPNQKERIILALRKHGSIVGFLGDGINDAPALHAADLGISVAGAVDVAKEAADIVLLERDLDVLTDGVREGRTTFANTLKYVFMATSANFGNMFSMAGASLFVAFLPLLPKQILLTNLFTDIPEMTIASDRVDRELVDQPRRWNVHFIRNFMLVFGALSSVFDFLTFGALLWLGTTIEQFRTGWFLESVVSATLIVLVIRSRRPFFSSRPGNYLLLATIGVVIAAVVTPYTPLAKTFGFAPLPPQWLLLLAGIVALYVGAAEGAKRFFYRLIGG